MGGCGELHLWRGGVAGWCGVVEWSGVVGMV